MARLTLLFWPPLHVVHRSTVPVPSRWIHSFGKTEVSAVRMHVCQLPSHLTGQQASLQTQHRSLPLICRAYKLCTDATSGHSWLCFSAKWRKSFYWPEVTQTDKIPRLWTVYKLQDQSPAAIICQSCIMLGHWPKESDLGQASLKSHQKWLLFACLEHTESLS